MNGKDQARHQHGDPLAVTHSERRGRGRERGFGIAAAAGVAALIPLLFHLLRRRGGGGPSLAPRPATVFVRDGQISVLPDPLPAGGERDVRLRWKLDQDAVRAHYRFPRSDAIVIEDPKDQFPNPPEIVGGNTMVRLRDRNTIAGDFKYTVRVVNRDPSRNPPPLDPIIRNGFN